MKILGQLAIIFVICFIGNIISSFLPVPFPGSVIAMIILFLCLYFKAVKTTQIQNVTDFLLGNMAFLFIPATVSIIEYIDVLKSVLFPFVFICIFTTFTTFLATAYSVKLTLHLMNKFGKKKGEAENV